jgi:hypothetical protein
MYAIVISGYNGCIKMNGTLLAASDPIARLSMAEPVAKKSFHRTCDRYQCPPFFSARITSGEKIDERATVENLSLRGMSVRTSCEFERNSAVEIELRSSYVAPVKIHARVRWIIPPECEGSSHVVGFSIQRVRIMDWLKFMRLITRLKKELW